ncbi:MAG: Zn-dependent protease with chaperone function [Gammaproteobacteria bacterium]|jgi:Zn-dependent protease with chaperone function
MVAMLSYLGWLRIVVLVLTPGAGGPMQLALSRTREFDADLGAVALMNDPSGLAQALEKLSRVERRWFRRVRTHRATNERIRRLRALSPHVPACAHGKLRLAVTTEPYLPTALREAFNRHRVDPGED